MPALMFVDEPAVLPVLEPTEPEPTELNADDEPFADAAAPLFVEPVPEPPRTPLAPIAEPTSLFELPVLPTSTVPIVLELVDAMPALEPFAVCPSVLEDEDAPFVFELELEEAAPVEDAPPAPPPALPVDAPIVPPFEPTAPSLPPVVEDEPVFEPMFSPDVPGFSPGITCRLPASCLP
ncbi:MAG: hypothetical protein IAI48_07145 [Candidatus Eremiobacteraeota bacterium]|nr:hypothetical protein [Candidatus Eremiobacteraeota bacterium]